LLPIAEKYDVAMLSECHIPTLLTRQHITDYLEFAEKHNSKYFGINADFGIFANKALPMSAMMAMMSGNTSVSDAQLEPKKEGTYCKPEDIIRILPTCRTCHAKFTNMSENFEEVTIPYKEILQILIEHGWSGQLVAEYEGQRRTERAYVGEQLRRHQILMQRILGY
jgi:hypothetical protein